MPDRSRTRYNVFFSLSQSAKANMPLKRLKALMPQAANAASITSVSLAVLKVYPASINSDFISG